MGLLAVNRNPSARQLRVFAAAWLVFLGIWGWGFWRKGAHPAAEAAWVLAAAVPLAGAADRRLLRLAYLGLSYAALPVGAAMSFLALAAVFYLVVTPIGLAGRLLGRDPLSRRRDPSLKSYWTAREAAKSVTEYFEQR
jgi:hypothetical protein